MDRLNGTVAEQLAAFATSLRLHNVPEDVHEKARLHVLDTLGIARRATEETIAGHLKRYLSTRPKGSSVTAFGSETNLEDAVTVNASLSHSLDFDDTHEGSLTHPSAVIVPTALAVAAEVGASGEKTTEAVVIGLEAVCALGAVGCSDFHSRFATKGFHPTAVCGAPAAALVTGYLLDLEQPAMAAAVAIAACLAGGSSQVISRGLATKMLNVGRAAATGIFSAQQAASGFPGGRGMLEEKRGFFEVLAGSDDLSFGPIEQLGSNWRIREIAFKEFPAGFGEHPFIWGALEARHRLQFRPEDIEQVVYGDLASQIANASEPAAEKRRPPSGYHGKFSRYFCIATALVREHATIEDFSDESARDELVLQVAERTTYEISPTRWLRVTLRDGRDVTVDLPGSVGSLSPDGVLEKFRRNLMDVNDVDGMASGFETLWTSRNVAQSVRGVFGAIRD